MMNPWVIIGFILFSIGMAAAGYYKGDELGRAAVQQQWDKEKTEQYAAHAKAQEEARATEQELQAKADKLRQEKDRETREATARIAALSNILRDRPTGPAEASSVSGSTGTGSAPAGCTGQGLYRPHGEFLVGEVADAKQCQTLLRECRVQYDDVREKLIRLNK